MSMINWREKFIAFLVHLLSTLVIAGAAAALVFLVWYPDPFQTMSGGFKFFLLITACDIVLGPLLSLVVYNSRKTRRALIFDYTFIGIVQIAAIAYGLFTIVNARPVYVAFVKDRFEIVAAKEIAAEDLAAGTPPYASLPMWGPKLIGTQAPTDVKGHNELVFSGAMSGKDMQVMPKYYVSYETVIDEVKERAEPLATLESRHPDAKALLSQAVEELGVDASHVRWLPVRTKGEFWTALIDAETWHPARYIPLDPY
jgi:hypothetical protein